MDDNKKSTTIWLRPSVISRMDGWLEADNCQSRSEFVDIAALGRIFDSVEDALKGLIKILILGRVFPNIGEELAGQNKKALCPDQIFSSLLCIRVRQISIRRLSLPRG